MTTFSKYRQLSVIAAIGLVLICLFTFAALWNSLLTSEVKHEGWVVAGMLLMLIVGLFLFYVAFILSDERLLKQAQKEAYESGKEEVLQEIEKQKKAEFEKKTAIEDLHHIIENILAGVQATRSLNGFCNKILANLAREMEFLQGIVYVKDLREGLFKPAGEYAITDRKPQPFKAGDTLPGEVAADKTMMILYDIPENYCTVSSGLGTAQPSYLLLVPVVSNGESIAVLELAAFKKPDESTGKVLQLVSNELVNKLTKFITA